MNNYTIRVVTRYYSFTYVGKAHPQVGESIHHNENHYIVTDVAHILRKVVDGNGITNMLELVEVQVV